MENWQLALVVLAAVLVGALLPALILVSLAMQRAAREVTAIGAQLQRSLAQVEVVAARVEVVSRGLAGGEQSLSAMVAAVGQVAHGLEQNMRLVNGVSAVMAAVGPAISAYFKARSAHAENDHSGPAAERTDHAHGPAVAAATRPRATARSATE